MIPNGPAKIRWLDETTDAGDRFEWVSFPNHLRNTACEGDVGATGYRVLAVNALGWSAVSMCEPEVRRNYQKIVFCPGDASEHDLRIALYWPHSREALEALVNRINERFWEMTISRQIAEILGLS